MRAIKNLCAESIGVSPQAVIVTAEQDNTAECIRQSLGLPTLPVLLSEKDVEKIGLRTAVSLRRDRCMGKSYLPFLKDPCGRIKYRTIDVLAAMSSSLNMPVAVDE